MKSKPQKFVQNVNPPALYSAEVLDACGLRPSGELAEPDTTVWFLAYVKVRVRKYRAMNMTTWIWVRPHEWCFLEDADMDRLSDFAFKDSNGNVQIPWSTRFRCLLLNMGKIDHSLIQQAITRFIRDEHLPTM